MEFSEAMNLLSKGVTAAGTLMVAWGAVQLGTSLKDHNGPGMQNSIFTIVGGAIIIAAAIGIKTVNM